MTRFEIASTRAEQSVVVVERGVVGRVAESLPETGRAAVAILTQPAVTRIAADIAADLSDSGLDVSIREMPDGDAAKTFTVVEDTIRWLNDRRLGRHDTVIGVGGGAATDVAGFVAAVFLRGIESVAVPTTLLGAVDASIGGKTAVNVGGKNLAGAFHHPSRVLIDPGLLEQLPRSLLREGAAEAIKAGFIADPDLVALYEADGLDAPVEDVVTRAVAVKCAVVSDDFTEQGRRAILNFGHTVGHAVETVAAMSHGEAVAVGMAAAGHVSAAIAGFDELDRLRTAIERLGMPVSAPGLDASAVWRQLRLDKKRDAAGLRMVVLDRIGSARVMGVDDATVTAALEAVGIG